MICFGFLRLRLKEVLLINPFRYPNSHKGLLSFLRPRQPETTRLVGNILGDPS